MIKFLIWFCNHCQGLIIFGVLLFVAWAVWGIITTVWGELFGPKELKEIDPLEPNAVKKYQEYLDNVLKNDTGQQFENANNDNQDDAF